MSYRRRSSRRRYNRSKRNLFATLLIVLILLFISFNYILPFFITTIGQASSIFKKSSLKNESVAENPILAPPVLIIPYEATNSAQIDIKGYATAGSKVKLFIDDQLADEIEVDSSGSFVFKDISLNLGTNNIYGKTVDDKNQESYSSKNIKLIYDNTKPTLSVTEPEDGKVVTGGAKEAKVSGKTDPDAQVTVNGTVIIVNSEGNFSSAISLTEGDNNFNIRATDPAGNFVEIARKVIYKSS